MTSSVFVYRAVWLWN